MTCNGRHGAGKVILRAAPAGTGIIAGGPMRAVFETLGMHDVVAKSLGSSNPYNMVRATFDALKREDQPAFGRGCAAASRSPTLQARRGDADGRRLPKREGGGPWQASNEDRHRRADRQPDPPPEGSQRATLIGLGLNKMHRRVDAGGHAAVRGMIAKVAAPRARRRRRREREESVMKLNDIRDNRRRHQEPHARRPRHRLGQGQDRRSRRQGPEGPLRRRIKGFEGGQMPLHRRLPKRGFNEPLRRRTSTRSTSAASSRRSTPGSSTPSQP